MNQPPERRHTAYEEEWDEQDEIITLKSLAIMIGVLALPVLYMLSAHDWRMWRMIVDLASGGTGVL
jgi:hypothetical protein